MIIINYLQYIREQEEKEPVIADQKKVFRLSEKLFMTLRKIKDQYKVAKFLLDLTEGVAKSNLVPDPVDYLDLVEDGNISFLKSRFFEEAKLEVWKSGRRQKSKASKILREIYNEAFINLNLKQTDIESFVNQWSMMNKKGAAEVVELRGDDVLRAYDLTKELDPNFGFSCAAGDRTSRNWNGSYSASCPDKYIQQRLEDEAKGIFFTPPHAKSKKAPEFPAGYERDVNFFKKGIS